MDKRVEHEERLYNDDGYESRIVAFHSKLGFANGCGYDTDYRLNIMHEFLQPAKGKKALELGTGFWNLCMDLEHYPPCELTCINISQRELDKGSAVYEAIRGRLPDTSVTFKIMDAHNLQFDDGSVDVVFGDAILHHLDFSTAVHEIHRVLKPGGICFFREPLASNPVAKLVRKLTPHARTPNEKPLGRKELFEIKKYFDISFSFSQLFYVPAGVISSRFTSNPYNRLMKAAFGLDRFLEKHSPLWFKLMFRQIYIFGAKRA